MSYRPTSDVGVYYQHPSLPVVSHYIHESGSILSLDEHDLQLKTTSFIDVEGFLGSQGYTQALALCAYSFEYVLPYVILRWVGVSDLAGQPLSYLGSPAKLIEIELDEDVDWEDLYRTHSENITRSASTFRKHPSNPFWVGGEVLPDIIAGDFEWFKANILCGWEKTLRKLGVLDLRIQSSLWNMFRRSE